MFSGHVMAWKATKFWRAWKSWKACKVSKVSRKPENSGKAGKLGNSGKPGNSIAISRIAVREPIRLALGGVYYDIIRSR